MKKIGYLFFLITLMSKTVGVVFILIYLKNYKLADIHHSLGPIRSQEGRGKGRCKPQYY